MCDAVAARALSCAIPPATLWHYSHGVLIRICGQAWSAFNVTKLLLSQDISHYLSVQHVDNSALAWLCSPGANRNLFRPAVLPNKGSLRGTVPCSPTALDPRPRVQDLQGQLPRAPIHTRRLPPIAASSAPSAPFCLAPTQEPFSCDVQNWSSSGLFPLRFAVTHTSFI